MRRAVVAALACAISCKAACGGARGQGDELLDTGAPEPERPADTGALAFTWGGYADTTVPLDFVARDHTVLVRFMPEYVFTGVAPILAENGPGTYLVGLAGGRRSGVVIDAGGIRQTLEPYRIDLPSARSESETVLFDFELGSYEGWSLEGRAFGTLPAGGSIAWQAKVTGAKGQYFVNSFNPDDSGTGVMRSKPFAITQRYLHFLIGGGRQPRRCELRLVVGGEVVRRATGRNSEQLFPEQWDLGEHLGKEGVLEIADASTESLGHVLVDEIVLSDRPTLTAGTWQHLAVVRRGASFAVYLNGVHLGPDLTLATEMIDPPTAESKLRIGRRTDGKAIDPDGRPGQLYGLVDEVAVLARALSEDEVKRAARAEAGVAPRGALAWLDLAGTEGVTLSPSGAAAVEVSPKRVGPADARRTIARASGSRWQLPFRAGQAWEVLEGYDDRFGANVGRDAFTLAFVFAGKAFADTEGQPVYAAAAGRVVRSDEDYPDGGASRNELVVALASGESAVYGSLQRGSVTRALRARPKIDKLPAIAAGQPIAAAGNTGPDKGTPKLRFSVTSLPSLPENGARLVTLPTPFDGYLASDDEGRTWTRVERGVPREGQWVRR